MLNLTGKKTTAKQIKLGVIEPREETRQRFALMSNFKDSPFDGEFTARAEGILKVVERELNYVSCCPEILLPATCLPPLVVEINRIFSDAGYEINFEFSPTEIVKI